MNPTDPPVDPPDHSESVARIGIWIKARRVELKLSLFSASERTYLEGERCAAISEDQWRRIEGMKSQRRTTALSPREIFALGQALAGPHDDPARMARLVAKKGGYP